MLFSTTFIRGRYTTRRLNRPCPTGIAFHGTADPWADTEMITNGCRKIGIPLYLTENANHSMETGDTLHDIFILHDIMDETARWMDSPA